MRDDAAHPSRAIWRAISEASKGYLKRPSPDAAQDIRQMLLDAVRSMLLRIPGVDKMELDDHKTTFILLACAGVIGGSLYLGGADRFRAQVQASQSDEAGAKAQLRAENIFVEQSCIAQAINRATQTTNFAVGDVPIDPMSVTTLYPQGTPIQGGYVCSSDGSLFRVESGQIVEHIGTSPRIREALVAGGFALEAQAMQQRAQIVYQISQEQ